MQIFVDWNVKRKNRKLFSLAIKRDVKGSHVKIMSRGRENRFCSNNKFVEAQKIKCNVLRFNNR